MVQKNLLPGFFRNHCCRIDSGSGSGPEQIEKVQDGYARRIDRAMLAEVAWPPAEQPQAFVCGPTALVETVAAALVALGHDPQRVKTERFGSSGGTP